MIRCGAMSRSLPACFCALGLAAWAASGPARAGELAEGAIAPPGECARADELGPPPPLRSPVASLFAPPGGSGSGGSVLSAAAGAGDSGSVADANAGGSPGADAAASSDSALAADEVDVAAGTGGAGSGSGAPALPGIRSFDGRGPCDDPGSGCGHLGGARPGFVVPPGGVMLRNGWIRFPDGSLIRAQRAGTSPVTPAARNAGGPP